MLLRRWVFLFFILHSPFCAFAIQVPAGFRDDILVDRLIQPTACEFAPDGRLFILQKQGAVRIFKGGHLLSQNALNLAVSDESERGLLGIAFDPGFENNHFLYLYYTTPGGNPKNRVSRFTINGDLIDPNSQVILLDGIRSDAGNHNAGWIQFGPDGKLYIATGDGGANSSNSQDLSGINGKILRINADGSIPPDNPFQGQNGRRGEIFCYGLRNPWRFTFDSQTGALYIADVGGGRFEELNIGRAGANYGWPGAEGPSDNPNFVNPVFSYPHGGRSGAITGGVVYRGNNFPGQFRGVYFFGDFVLGFIRYLKLSSSNTVEFVHDFSPAAGAVVHFANGPDGAVYYVDFGGRIHRIFFASGNNGVPVAKASANRKSGILPLAVTFSGDGSFDPDRNPLRFEWQFGDGTSARNKVVSHTYSRSQNFVATLTVVDSRGARSNPARIRIFAGDRPPIPLIQIPHSGTLANPGQLIRFSGLATDPDEGVLDPSHLTWTVVLHHNDHTHPFLGPLVGVRRGSFRIPVNDHTTGHVFFRIRLKATDSRGMPIFRFVDVQRN